MKHEIRLCTFIVLAFAFFAGYFSVDAPTMSGATIMFAVCVTLSLLGLVALTRVLKGLPF